MREDPQLGGQWKVLSLMALETNIMLGGQWGNILFGGQWKALSLVALEMNLMFGGQWGNILFGGQWKVPSLVALGMFNIWLPLEGEGKTFFFTSFHFLRHKVLLKLFFH